MAQKELKYTKGYSIDEGTGYKTSNDPRSKMSAQVKKIFIQTFSVNGDIADTCQAIGISRRILAPHLRADSKFRQDLKRAKENLKEQPKLHAQQAKQSVITRLMGSLPNE